MLFVVLAALFLHMVGMSVAAIISIIAPESRIGRYINQGVDEKPALLQEDIDAALRELDEIPDPLRDRFLLLEKEKPAE